MTFNQWGEITGALQFGSRYEDWVTGVALLKNDDIFVSIVRERGSGMLGRDPQGGWDSMVARFSSDLIFLWSTLCCGENNDIFSKLTKYDYGDGVERALVVGTIDGEAPFSYSGTHSNGYKGGKDILLAMYSGEDEWDPTHTWQKHLGSDGDDIPTNIASGADGSIYVIGYTNGNLNMTWFIWQMDDPDVRPGGWDAFIMKFENNGKRAPEWVWTSQLGTQLSDYAWAITFLPGSDPAFGGDLLVSGTTRTNWPEADAETPVSHLDTDHPDIARSEVEGVDAWLITFAPVDGRMTSWQKQIRSPGSQNITALASEKYGGHVYAVGISNGGLTPELGSPGLNAYGGDAMFMKFTWARSAATCYRGSTCEAGLSDGVGLGLNDEAIISPKRCGRGVVNAEGVPDTPADGRVVVDPFDPNNENPGQRFQWGNKAEERVIRRQSEGMCCVGVRAVAQILTQWRWQSFPCLDPTAVKCESAPQENLAISRECLERR